jgi:hypothetical protein
MKLIRYEIYLPLLYNDGQAIEKYKFIDTFEELISKFGAATADSTKIIGRWIYKNQLYEDKLMRFFVDVPDVENHEEFFRHFKEILKERFQQIDIWITSYEINVI